MTSFARSRSLRAPLDAVRRIPPRDWFKWALIVAALVGFSFLAVTLLPLLPTSEIRGAWETPFPVVLLGVIGGLTYGLLGMGLVLIFRTNRIINFAHGELGAFGAALFALSVVRWHLPYWIAFPLILIVSAGVGALIEVAVVRRLKRAPRLMSVVATLGVAQFLVQFAAAINAEAQAGALFPNPPWMPKFNVGPLLVTQAYSAMLILTPIVLIAIALFLKRSRFGLAILGSAANSEAARMSGIYASRMSSMAWGIAGALSAFTAILIQPTQGVSGQGFFGPSLLMRALACAAIARMSNLTTALLAGIGIGIVEQLVTWNYGQASLMTVVLFVLIVVALLVQRPTGGRDEEKGSWAAVQALKPIPDAFRQLWIARNLGRVVGVLGLAFAAALPLFVTHSASITLTGIIGFTVVGLSVGLITGLGGQLTLGQFALAAMGGVASLHVSRRTGNFGLAFAYAGVAGAIASLIIGLPALRIKGLLLTVTTLSFALLVPGWLLGQPWMIGQSGVLVPPVEVFGRELSTGRSYYVFALSVFVVVFWLTRNVWRGGMGRVLRGIRDNEDNARAFTIPATAMKTQAFLLSGFIAGVGGALYTHSLTAVSSTSFVANTSIFVVTMTVVGGISLLAGPLLGVLLVVGVPAFFPEFGAAALAATHFGTLLIILYVPGGLGSLVEPMRDRLLGWFARRAGIDPSGDTQTADALSTAADDREVAEAEVRPNVARPRFVAGEVLLSTENLRKSFGGLHAVDGVSMEVRSGEIVGLIGPNGAGKTTTFELIAGFTAIDDGVVRFDGRDVTWFSPEQRGRLGMIRSFQDAALFPTLTVQDVVQLSLERVAPTRLVSSTLGFHGPDRAKERRARELISFMGLDAFRTKQVLELSTGTRRVLELACMIALEPTLLLLDEPSSGIAQRETEQLAVLLEQLRTDFGMTLLVIEHDIPLIMGLSDRIIAMADGKVIAEGPPNIVRDHPKVVESYLGGSIIAIERSGEVPSNGSPAPQPVAQKA